MVRSTRNQQRNFCYEAFISKKKHVVSKIKNMLGFEPRKPAPWRRRIIPPRFYTGKTVKLEGVSSRNLTGLARAVCVCCCVWLWLCLCYTIKTQSITCHIESTTAKKSIGAWAGKPSSQKRKPKQPCLTAAPSFRPITNPNEVFSSNGRKSTINS